jgi:hypothetical protein
MAPKHKTSIAAPLRPVTAERAARLCRMLYFLSTGPQTREVLTRHLGRDIRSFYRDLELVRASGIDVPLDDGRYSLAESAETAIARLPFPDPRLTLGEARELAKGRSPAHRKLKQIVDQIVEPPTRRRKSK